MQSYELLFYESVSAWLHVKHISFVYVPISYESIFLTGLCAFTFNYMFKGVVYFKFPIYFTTP